LQRARRVQLGSSDGPSPRCAAADAPHRPPPRQVLSGFAGTVALLAASAAQANTPIDLFDDRGARKKGFDLIYEARDLDLPQNVRDGLTQARSDIASTKQRVKESEKRLDNDVLPSINKAYWWAPGAGAGWGRFRAGDPRAAGACGMPREMDDSHSKEQQKCRAEQQRALHGA
jgi:hypothetical protein